MQRCRYYHLTNIIIVPVQVNMATMRVESSLHGLRPPPQQIAAVAAAVPLPAALAVQPGSGHLVVAGPHAMLQFYDALRCGGRLVLMYWESSLSNTS